MFEWEWRRCHGWPRGLGPEADPATTRRHSHPSDEARDRARCPEAREVNHLLGCRQSGHRSAHPGPADVGCTNLCNAAPELRVSRSRQTKQVAREGMPWGPHRAADRRNPGGQQRTAGDNERRRQRPVRSDSPGTRNPCPRLHCDDHSRGHRSVRLSSASSRPALRAAACGGRPRAGNDTTGTGEPASPTRNPDPSPPGSQPRCLTSLLFGRCFQQRPADRAARRLDPATLTI
jgi:hypothetical protein